MGIGKAGLTLLGGDVGARVGGILFKLILLATLNPASYGEFAIFLILFNWTTLAATLNITIGLTKFVSEKRVVAKAYYRAALIGCSVISLVLAVVLIGLTPQISPAMGIKASPVLPALAIVLPLAVAFNLTIFYFRGLYRMRVSAASQTALAGVRVAALLMLLWAGWKHSPYVAFVLSFLLLDVMLFLIAGPKLGLGTYGSGLGVWRLMRQLLLYSLPIFLSEMSRWLARGLDRMVLARFWTATASGIYDVAATFCLGYMLIANSYANALLPIASKNQRNPDKLRVSLARTLCYFAGLYVMYTMVIFSLAKPILGMLNPAYMAVLDFLPALAAAYMLMGLLSLLCHFVNAIGLQRYAVAACALFLFMCLGLNLYLVPSMKYLGAALAILGSTMAAVAVGTALIWRGLKLRS